MTPRHPGRRRFLKAAAAAAIGAVGAHRPANAQIVRQSLRIRIDRMLRAAIRVREVPGVVAAASSDTTMLYDAAYGVRGPNASDLMTRDTIFRVASMTKAVTAVAAMQLVEQGKLKLDEPVPHLAPAIGSPLVLEGFDAAGAPKLRPAKRPITLRHLLTHTAGFTYPIWNANIGRYAKVAGTPSLAAGELGALNLPLAFDPGDRWEYGISMDWVGRIVEAVSGQPLDVYFRDRIFAPLEMKDTGYVLSADQRARLAALYVRGADGALVAQPPEPPPSAAPQFRSGGGGLYSTGSDYLAFLEMLLRGGVWGNARLLRPGTVALMSANHIGELPAGVLKTQAPALSNDVDLFPGAPIRWSLTGMVNVQAGPNGRSAGTVSWAGLFNTYFWLDPSKRLTGLFLTQILPFADTRALETYGRYEGLVYELVNHG